MSKELTYVMPRMRHLVSNAGSIVQQAIQKLKNRELPFFNV